MRLIVNPAAGGPAGRRAAAAVLAQLRAQGTDHDVVVTGGPGHATELARAALAEGVRHVVAVGGDGTVREVLGGMAGADGRCPGDAVLGLAVTGTGGDVGRTFGLARAPTAIAARLRSPRSLPIDAGAVSTVGRDGRPVRCLFLNVAEVGFGSGVVRAAARLPPRLGRWRYPAGAVLTARRLRPVAASVTLDGVGVGVGAGVGVGETVALDRVGGSVPVSALVVANGRWFGGGMLVAPGARPDDGLFDVLRFGGGPARALALVPGLYRGRHTRSRAVATARAAAVTVDAAEPLDVEADGDVLGTTPATFTVLPRFVRLQI